MLPLAQFIAREAAAYPAGRMRPQREDPRPAPQRPGLARRLRVAAAPPRRRPAADRC
jgi:hypothetical protein